MRALTGCIAGLMLTHCVTTDLSTVVDAPATVASLPPPMEPDVPAPPEDTGVRDGLPPLDQGRLDAGPEPVDQAIVDQSVVDMSLVDPSGFEGQCMDASTCPYDDVCFALRCVPPVWTCTCVHVRDGQVPDEECGFWGLPATRNQVDPRAAGDQTYRQTDDDYDERCAVPANALGSPCDPNRNTCRSGSCGGDNQGRTFCTRNCDEQTPCPPEFDCIPLNPMRSLCVPP